MNTCDTCKHWKKAEDWDELCNPIIWNEDGERITPEYSFQVRICRHPKLRFCERPLSPDEAAVKDASHYCADLCTGPKFGCTAHEPGDPDAPEPTAPTGVQNEEKEPTALDIETDQPLTKKEESLRDCLIERLQHKGESNSD